MNYIYKALPFKGSVADLDPNRVAAQLTILINSQSQEGWEFFQINSVNISVNPGCLSGLFGEKSSEQKYDMAIFRMSKEETKNNIENNQKNIANNSSWKPNCPQCGIGLKEGASGCQSCGYMFNT